MLIPHDYTEIIKQPQYLVDKMYQETIASLQLVHQSPLLFIVLIKFVT